MANGFLLGAVCYQEYQEGYLDFLELSAELKLGWVEFKYEPPLCVHSNSKKYKEIRKRADLLGIGLSMHTAFDGLNIASIDNCERTNSIERVKESITAASDMEITYATLHPGHLMSVNYSDDNWEDSKKFNIESIIELVSFADELGLILCLENGNAFKRSSLKHGVHPGDLKYIRENVGEKLKYTVDIGHALFLSRDPSFLVSELGLDNVKLSHLHSNSGRVDSHSPLNTGVLELDIVIKKYSKEKWTFPLSIEMKSEDNLRNSLKVVRKIISKIEGK
jgi:sugar phosphate isomerase/epimerase